ncbi:MAG: PadR family transcriptional regulator [Bryobacteraceae bacterium]
MAKRPSPERQQRPGDLIPGTLEVLIMKAVSRARKIHGYAIAEWIHTVSEETLRVEEGALYPALHRLELRGLLEPEWGLSDTNRRVKFYRLTTAGRKSLTDEREYWRRMTASVMRVLESA